MVHILDIPAHVEAALRAQADAEGKTLDEIVLEAIARGVGVAPEPPDVPEPPAEPQRDLSFMRMDPEDIRAIEEAEACFEQIDEDLWR